MSKGFVRGSNSHSSHHVDVGSNLGTDHRFLVGPSSPTMPRKIPIVHNTPRTTSIRPQLPRLNGTTAQLPYSIIRHYAAPPQKKSPTNAKRPPQRSSFVQYDQKDADKFSLREAMRYLRAFEVGQDTVHTKYELAVKLFAMKNGPTIKHRVKLPVPVKTDARVCVIAEGKAKEDALKAGAEVAGTTEVFELVCEILSCLFYIPIPPPPPSFRIPFTARLICTIEQVPVVHHKAN